MEGGLIGGGVGMLAGSIYVLRSGSARLPDRPLGRHATGLVYARSAWQIVYGGVIVGILIAKGAIGPGNGWPYFVAAALFLAGYVISSIAHRRVVDHFDGTYVVEPRHPVVLWLAPAAVLVGGATVFAALVFERPGAILWPTLIGSVLGISGVVVMEITARRAVRPRPTLEE